MFVKIERKLFEMTMVGKKGGCLIERNTSRRSSVILTMEDRTWLEKVWTQFWEGDMRGWFRRRRLEDITLIMQSSENKWGRMVTLLVSKKGIYQTVICPEGQEQQGWKMWVKAMKETNEGSKVVALQRTNENQNMIDNRSWSEVFSIIPGPREQVAHKTGKVILVEICCDNCGWTLKVSFMPNVDKPTQFNTQRQFKPLLGRGSNNEIRSLNQQVKQRHPIGMGNGSKGQRKGRFKF